MYFIILEKHVNYLIIKSNIHGNKLNKFHVFPKEIIITLCAYNN